MFAGGALGPARRVLLIFEAHLCVSSGSPVTAGHVDDVAATWSHEDAIAATASARRRKDKDLNTPRPPSAWHLPEPLLRGDPP